VAAVASGVQSRLACHSQADRILSFANMLEVNCKGTPYEVRVPSPAVIPQHNLNSLCGREQIGYEHGSKAAKEVAGTVNFYADLFKETAKIDWPAVRTIASQFEGNIKSKWPDYYSELQGKWRQALSFYKRLQLEYTFCFLGVAEGAKLDIHDIIAINVRTEITFGHFSDGCTSLAWKTADHSFLGQNWDVRLH
jgi:hypothetical protein